MPPWSCWGDGCQLFCSGATDHGGGKRVCSLDRSLASVSNGCAVSSVCMRLSETVPATGSKRKNLDYLQSRSARIPQLCGIGSSSTRLRAGLLLSTRVHHHKLGWMRFRTTLPPQEQQYQLSVLQGFSPRRSLLGCV